MADLASTHTPEFRAAFLANERAERLRTGKVASLLVAVLMPAGITLDFFCYRSELNTFLLVRLLCSALALGLWYLHTLSWAERNYKLLGLPIAWLPAAGICWMIHVTDGPTSPYYAGLNLILLAISVVVHWNVRESLLGVAGVLLMYSVTSLPRAEPQQLAIIFNNYYFLVLTGIIVVTGNYMFDRLRQGEFAARFEVDRQRRLLEASNQQLSQKTAELELSNAQLNATKGELEKSNQQLSQQKRQLEETLQELKRTQDELITSEKQASLGVWSAGIIHEINNPLNFVRTGLYALRNAEKHLPESERAEFKEVMADIDDGVRRVHSIVEDLRSYAHPKNETLSLVPLADVTRVALRFCSEGLRGRVEVVERVPDNFLVYAERNKLIQVLTNLLQNSIHALEEKRFDGEAPTIVIEGRSEGDRRLVVVRDNGPGIALENQEKIFDPFFTTKAPGEGMGLGLGICYRIIQGFGGTIRMRSEPGQFCEFTLDLRAAAPASTEDFDAS
jgi:two-component system sensor histidine kinase PhcS